MGGVLNREFPQGGFTLMFKPLPFNIPGTNIAPFLYLQNEPKTPDRCGILFARRLQGFVYTCICY